MDYSKCLVNIGASDTEVIYEFGRLHESLAVWVETREDKLEISTINIIKYIVLCYDYESPVVKEHKTKWTVKKREAAKASGMLMLKSASASKGVEEILYCENPIINQVTVRYLALLSDRDFLMYAIYNELLIKQSGELMKFQYDKPMDVINSKKLIEQLQEDIAKLENKLFSGDDVRELKNILQEESNKFMVSELRPENLVSKNEKGEMVVESPYGEGYKMADLRFLDDK